MRTALLLVMSVAQAAEFELTGVRRIWDQPPHAAFGDLIRWKDQWWAVFREGKGHAPSPGKPDDGVLRVISSKDGESWRSRARIEETGVDLRDPHLSITASKELMIIAGGSYYPNGEYRTRRGRTFFSRDGERWSAPNPVMEDGHWLWRAIWHNGKAWGVSKYGSHSAELANNPRKIRFVSSDDGKQWSGVTQLDVPGGDETTVRVLPDGRMMALTRRTWTDGNIAWIGVAKSPYREWEWSPSGHFIGGPNFLPLPGGVIAAGGRLYEYGDRSKAFTSIGEIKDGKYHHRLRLPSNGDSSYPGFVWHNGLLWILYYSSHEGKTSIYLAKVKLR